MQGFRPLLGRDPQRREIDQNLSGTPRAGNPLQGFQPRVRVLAVSRHHHALGPERVIDLFGSGVR